MEQECLAIPLGVQAFRFYLLGKPFVIQADHRGLTVSKTTTQDLQDGAFTYSRFSTLFIIAQDPPTAMLIHCEGSTLTSKEKGGGGVL